MLLSLLTGRGQESRITICQNVMCTSYWRLTGDLTFGPDYDKVKAIVPKDSARSKDGSWRERYRKLRRWG